MVSRPKKLDRLALSELARLMKARLAAGEARFDTAMPEFAALEKIPNEKIAAQAAYYRTEAGMAAGTVSDKQPSRRWSACAIAGAATIWN